MSHLLYLHSFSVDRFRNVFGGGNRSHVALLLKKVHPNAIKLSPSDASALVTKAIMRGLDGRPVPQNEQQLLDAIVDVAVTTKAFGIAPTPISSMGAGGGLFDAFETRFVKQGETAKALFRILQRGRNDEGGIILLSPDDVSIASKILRAIAGTRGPRADEMDEAFDEELVQPFAASAKKGRAIFGRWD